MGTISIRMPDNLERELKQFAKEETLEQTSDAARKLIAKGIEGWRKEKAFQCFIQDKCTMSKAAEIARISIWEFMDIVRERKIPWITDKHSLLEDIEKAKQDANSRF